MRKKKQNLKFDPLTQQITWLILKLPRGGEKLASLYLWRPMMFNFMLVGTTGTLISWLLYEGFFRILFLPIPIIGTFLGMAITAILVFLWNYTWNIRWSLNVDAQIMKMRKHELQDLKDKVEKLLSSKFDHKGNRV